MEQDNVIEVNPEYVYMMIPTEYVCIYQRLLVYLADLGKSQIDDCNATCKGSGKNIITCWNLFQSAIACYNLNRIKEAEFFIEYIKTQISNIYDNDEQGLIPFNNTVPVSISEDVRLKAVVGCGADTKFYVDVETGKLYHAKSAGVDTNKEYLIEDNNLINKENE